jgi:hypothetical protein
MSCATMEHLIYAFTFRTFLLVKKIIPLQAQTKPDKGKMIKKSFFGVESNSSIPFW